MTSRSSSPTKVRPRFKGSRHKRPVQSDGAQLEEFGRVLAALALVDQLAGVVDLLPG